MKRIDLLAKPFPTIGEFFLMIVVVTMFIVFVTLVDILIHDSYIGPIIAECNAQNNSEFCEKMRASLINDSFFWNVDYHDPQLQLGGTYWFTLLLIPLFVAVLLAIFRPVMGILAGAKINPMLFIIGLLWGFSVIVLYYFGWLDFLYYFLRNIPIPETLIWLNGVGAFQLVQHLGPTENVDKSDLLLLMGIGIVLLISVWAFFIHHHKKKTWHRLGLI